MNPHQKKKSQIGNLKSLIKEGNFRMWAGCSWLTTDPVADWCDQGTEVLASLSERAFHLLSGYRPFREKLRCAPSRLRTFNLPLRLFLQYSGGNYRHNVLYMDKDLCFDVALDCNACVVRDEKQQCSDRRNRA